MRALVLALAMVLCAGSATNANQRYALSNYSCGSKTGTAQQACYAQANTQYVVQSQREMVGEQNARVDQQVALQQQQQQRAAWDEMTRRCEAVTRSLLQCQLVEPATALPARDYCIFTLGPNATASGYGKTLCLEQATTCDAISWCLAH